VASTSTNKQPMMVDRPFLRGAKITSATATVSPVNTEFANLVQLVRVGDIPSEDAASACMFTHPIRLRPLLLLLS
jgi:hypothetical protein